jgi:hypothetical protein
VQLMLAHLGCFVAISKKYNCRFPSPQKKLDFQHRIYGVLSWVYGGATLSVLYRQNVPPPFFGWFS